jgi:hypothetical protein
MSFDLLILGLGAKATMAVSESLKLLAGYPLQLIKAKFIASGNYDFCVFRAAYQTTSGFFLDIETISGLYLKSQKKKIMLNGMEFQGASTSLGSLFFYCAYMVTSTDERSPSFEQFHFQPYLHIP